MASNWKRRCGGIWLGAALVVMASSFAATAFSVEPDLETRQLAQHKLVSGLALLSRQEYLEAQAELEASHELQMTPAVLAALGDCNLRLKRPATARVFYRRLQKQLELLDSDPDRAAMANIVASFLDALEPQVPTLSLVVAPDQARSSIEIDGREVTQQALESELPWDPGAIEIVGTEAGKPSWSRRIDLAAGEHRVVKVPEPIAPAEQVAPPARPPVSGPAQLPVPSSSARRAELPVSGAQPRASEVAGASAAQRLGAYVVGGAGLLSLTAGGYFLSRSFAEHRQSAATRQARAAVVGLGAALLDAAVFVYLFSTEPPDPRHAVEPRGGNAPARSSVRGLGLVVRGDF